MSKAKKNAFEKLLIEKKKGKDSDFLEKRNLLLPIYDAISETFENHRDIALDVEMTQENYRTKNPTIEIKHKLTNSKNFKPVTIQVGGFKNGDKRFPLFRITDNGNLLAKKDILNHVAELIVEKMNFDLNWKPRKDR